MCLLVNVAQSADTTNVLTCKHFSTTLHIMKSGCHEIIYTPVFGKTVSRGVWMWTPMYLHKMTPTWQHVNKLGLLRSLWTNRADQNVYRQYFNWRIDSVDKIYCVHTFLVFGHLVSFLTKPGTDKYFSNVYRFLCEARILSSWKLYFNVLCVNYKRSSFWRSWNIVQLCIPYIQSTKWNCPWQDPAQWTYLIQSFDTPRIICSAPFRCMKNNMTWKIFLKLTVWTIYSKTLVRR